MRKKTFIFLFTFIIILNTITTVYADSYTIYTNSYTKKPPSTITTGIVLMDFDSGRVLYQKNPNMKIYPASTTKVLTCIIALESGKLEDKITVGDLRGEIDPRSSHIALQEGETLTLEQLLYAIMLESANDAAVVIAEHFGGSVSGFSKIMNEKAKQLGAVNSNFVNPNGLDNKNHYSTPSDMAIITRYAMSNQTFRSIVSTISYTIPATEKQPIRNYIRNGNQLIWKSLTNYNYQYAIGVKTGYTTAAGFCLISAAKKDKTEVIATLYKGTNTSIYTDSKNLFDYVFANYKKRNVLTKDQIVGTASVTNSEEKFNLLAEKSLPILLLDSELPKLNTVIEINPLIKTPVIKGNTYGKVYVYFNDKLINKSNLIAAQDIKWHLLPTIKLPPFWWSYPIIAFLLYRVYVKFTKKRRRRRNRTTYYSRDGFGR